MIVAKEHVMKLAYARGSISYETFLGLCIPTSRDLTNLNGDLGYKHAAVARRTWSQVDEAVAELAARENNGLYMSRFEYFSDPDTIDFYKKHDLVEEDMTFSTRLSKVSAKKYGDLLKWT